MTARPLAVAVLAAGQGVRMASGRPKVLHEVAGRPMLAYVLEAVAALEPARVVVVVGPDMDEVAAAAAPHAVAVQRERLGTGHAVLAAREALLGGGEPAGLDVLVVYGDQPLVTRETLARLVEARRQAPDAPLAALAFRAAAPGGYGRMILDERGRLAGVVEAADAPAEVLEVDLCNAGLVHAEAEALFALLERVGRDNAKGEYYLTDIYGLAARDGRPAAVATAPAEEVLGVNSRAELAAAEAAMQRRLRARALDGGATLLAPETVHLNHDTRLAPDAVVEPHVVFGPGVTVGEGARVRAFSHLEGATLEVGAAVGPFARLRAGSVVGHGARIGNFVETKNARLAEGAKANHLAYLGDVEVGAGANIGAGTITCNYDGIAKHATAIGPGAFIGSNAALVAPVAVGEGAIVGAGSVITRDVAAGALAVARGRQHDVAGGAARFRARRRGDADEDGG